MAKIPKRQKIKNHVAPIEEEQHEQRGRKRGELDVAPEKIAVIAFAQFSANRAYVVAKETQEHIAPRIFRFATVPVPVNRKPIDRVTLFILPIGVALVMLHVHRVVVGLGKAARDRLRDSKEPIQ